MKYALRMPTRDELTCLLPGVIAFGAAAAFAGIGALAGWLPRTFWMLILLIVAAGALAMFLSLTPPVLHARARMLQANIIEPTQLDEEPDLASSDAYDKNDKSNGNG